MRRVHLECRHKNVQSVHEGWRPMGVQPPLPERDNWCRHGGRWSGVSRLGVFCAVPYRTQRGNSGVWTRDPRCPCCKTWITQPAWRTSGTTTSSRLWLGFLSGLAAVRWRFEMWRISQKKIIFFTHDIIHTHICVCIYVCMYMHLYVYVHMYTHIHVYMCTFIYTRICVCINMFMYT